MKNWMWGAICIISMIVVYNSYSGYTKEIKSKEMAAVKAVQESKGRLEGVSTIEGIATIIGFSDATGNYVKVEGWSCSYKSSDNTYDIWFEVNENDKLNKFHWVIDADKNLHPANDMAQMVTKRQRVSL